MNPGTLTYNSFEFIKVARQVDPPIYNLQKRQGSLANVRARRFVFTNFQADNYGTSSGDDEGNCVYN